MTFQRSEPSWPKLPHHVGARQMNQSERRVNTEPRDRSTFSQQVELLLTATITEDWMSENTSRSHPLQDRPPVLVIPKHPRSCKLDSARLLHYRSVIRAQ